MITPAWRSSRYTPYVIVAIAFTLSRIAAHIAGIDMGVGVLEVGMQLLDLDQLTADPLTATWYMHTQPPLFNLFVAAMLGLGEAAHVFEVVYTIFGLALSLLICWSALHLGVRPWIAALAAVLYTVHPTTIAYEHYAFYTYPAALLILAIGAAMSKAVGHRSFAWASAAVGLTAVLALTRSTYHLIVVIAVTGAMWRVVRVHRLRAWLLLPLLAVAGMYVKNLRLFDEFGVSTWMGPSLARMTVSQLTDAELAKLRPALSELAHIPPFSAPHHYPDSVFVGPSLHPVLMQPYKNSGAPNFNHIGYTRISKVQKRDALVVLKRSPTAYIRGVADAWRHHFMNAGAYFVIMGTQGIPQPLARGLKNIPLAAVFWPLALLAGVLMLLWQKDGRTTFVAYAVAMVVYAALVGNSLEVGENMRFRFETDALLWIVAAVAIDRLITEYGRRQPVHRRDKQHPTGPA